MAERRRESWWRLPMDLGSARALVWVVSLGREVELTKDAHLYFADRYQRLSDVHRAHRRFARAERLERKAEEHLRATGWDDSRGGDGHAEAGSFSDDARGERSAVRWPRRRSLGASGCYASSLPTLLAEVLIRLE